jgi:hypothetical protein
MSEWPTIQPVPRFDLQLVWMSAFLLAIVERPATCPEMRLFVHVVPFLLSVSDLAICTRDLATVVLLTGSLSACSLHQLE